MDTLSDPFSAEVRLVVEFTVLFKPGFEVLEKGVKVDAGTVPFAAFLLVMSIQPLIRIKPAAITRARNTISFIVVLLHDV